VSLGSNIFQ